MQRVLPRRPFKKLELTPHNEWSQKFWDDLIPYKDAVAKHPYFREVQNGSLSIEQCQRGLVDFYPLVENFPKYMGLNLAKTKRGEPGHLEAKYWLIQNIKVEQNHAEWWHFWANGFGIEDEALTYAKPSPLMDAINNYLWHIGTKCSLEEGLAATNLAVEWATGEWSIAIVEGIKSYSKSGKVDINERTMSWLNAHASYDDEHPYEAMEVIKRICVTKEMQDRAFEVAKRSLEYYTLALDDCLSPSKNLVAA